MKMEKFTLTLILTSTKENKTMSNNNNSNSNMENKTMMSKEEAEDYINYKFDELIGVGSRIMKVSENSLRG